MAGEQRFTPLQFNIVDGAPSVLQPTGLGACLDPVDGLHQSLNLGLVGCRSGGFNPARQVVRGVRAQLGQQVTVAPDLGPSVCLSHCPKLLARAGGLATCDAGGRAEPGQGRCQMLGMDPFGIRP